MNEIITNKRGLPLNKLGEQPLLKLFNFGKKGKVNYGRLIFSDGLMFMLGKREGEEYQWIEFTQIKAEGIELLKQTVKKEFFLLNNEAHRSSSANTLYWQAYLGEKTKSVILPSVAYNQLPPVFEKIDELINRFMYKMNERIIKK